MSFCTAINCMDGRVQLPVIKFLIKRLNVDYVDSITEPGPVKILAEQSDLLLSNSIFNRISVSVNKHKSKAVVICAHADCAGNPVDDETQKEQLEKAGTLLANKYPDVTVLKLWIDIDWNVHEQ